ncbi:TetR/AcrR family transcriptional regulator [Actinoplanes sp. NPDC051851]|uniref:TetR/AcrR family transcriptional regulator n=1 Tax=Actinoplanes sp. NPDC051851 TaxID=3154753 RepID=UPI003437DD92
MISTPPGVRAAAGSDKLERWRRLREAALTLFEQHGYAAVSVDDIAAAAGVSRRTFFNHFETKAAALFDPDPQEAARMTGLLDQEGTADPWQGLTRSLKAFLTAEFRVVATRRRIVEGRPELNRLHFVANANFEESMLAWLAAQGIGDLESRVLTSAALGCVRESFMAWDPAGTDVDLFAILDQMLTLVATGTASIAASRVAFPGDGLTGTDTSSARSGSTRARILLTAERLFAEYGVFAVSNRQISEAAGQGNNAAVSYHFGTKPDLLHAIVQRHNEPMESIRQRLLQARTGSTDLRDWVACMVLPFTLHLGELGTPTWYGRLAAQIMTEPSLRKLAASELHDARHFYMVIDGLHRCLPGLTPELRRRRDDMARMLLVHTCAHRERTLPDDSEAARTAWATTAAELIDAIEGLYRAPVTIAENSHLT